MSTVVERRENVTSIVICQLVDGFLHKETKHFLKRLAANLAHK